MKKLLLLMAFSTAAAALCNAQAITMADLLGFSSLPSKKFDNYIEKKGFRMAGRNFVNDTIVDTWQQVVQSTDSTQPPVVRRVCRYQNKKNYSYSLQTSVQKEFQSAIARLKQDGFFFAASQAQPGMAQLFQKGTMTVETSFYPEDSLTYYSLLLHEQQMPSSKIIYANDLMQFTSHEYLAAFFGRENVRNDVYYFSEKEISKCSVLFPNTARQAVFIWEDEDNLRGLSQVVISGRVPTESSAEFNQQVRENTWLLSDGLHFDMRLEELVRLNGQDVSFYGNNTSSPFMVIPQRQGNIDLATTSVILDCINCKGSSLLDNKVISAIDALNNDLRLHVGMIILLPDAVPDAFSRR